MAEEVKQDSLAVSTVQSRQELAQSARQTRLAAFTPTNLTEAIALAKMMAGSDMVPKEYKGKAANIIVAIQFGSEVGLAPMQSLQSVAVINGRPCLWGDGALGLVQGHPDFEDIQETTEGTVATCIIKRKGRTPCKRTFSDEDAQKAGLLSKGGVWNQYRARMRQMRARGFALRDSFADVLKGISIAEEAMDIPVDNSQAKQQREAMTFDVGAFTPSTEPNRGHEDTGLGRPKLDEQKQADPKPDKVMCNECRQIDSHTENCSQYADWLKSKQDAKTSKPTSKAAVLVLEAKRKTKKGGEPFLVLEVVAADNTQGKLYVWHKSFFEYLASLKDKPCLFELSEQTKDGKKFHQIEHILEIAGVQFVEDKPAAQGTLDIPAETKTEDDEDWDVG